MIPTTPPTQLRAMSLGDLFDTIFRIYRSNFLTFIGIAALLQMPMILLQLLLTLTLGRQFIVDQLQLSRALATFNPRVDTFADLPISSLIAFIGFSLLLLMVQVIFVQQLINGALAHAISQRYMNQPISILGAYNLGGSRIGSLFLVGVIVMIIGFLAAIVLGGIYIGGVLLLIGAFSQTSGGGSIAGAILGVIGIILFIFLLIILFAMFMLRFIFATQAVVLEGSGPLAAMGRSWRLIRGSFWRVFGIVLLLFILVLLLVNIPVAMVNFILSSTLGNPLNPLQNYGLLQSILVLTNYGAQILVLPVLLIAYTLLYYDLRVRKEGYDLQLMAAQTFQTEAR